MTAQEWHQLFLRRLRQSGSPEGRVRVHIAEELDRLCRRTEISWELVQEVQAVVEELTTRRVHFDVLGDPVRIHVAPLWTIVEAIMTGDEDWDLEDETTWVLAEVTLQVGTWYHREKEVRQHDDRQPRLF